MAKPPKFPEYDPSRDGNPFDFILLAADQARAARVTANLLAYPSRSKLGAHARRPLSPIKQR